MLKKILSSRNCAECRKCCVFDRYDIWETPLFDEEMCTKIRTVRPGTEFVRRDGGSIFKADNIDAEQLFSCPALTENGCILGDEKPFECRIFPYRIMNIGERRAIVLASDCEAMFSRPLSELMEVLKEGLAEEIFAYADSHPSIVKPYYEGYPVLVFKR